MLSLIRLRDINMEMSVRKLHIRDGIQRKGLDNTTSGAKICYLKLQNQIRLPRKLSVKRNEVSNDPAHITGWEDWDGRSERGTGARRKRWDCRVLEAKRRNQGSVLNTTAKVRHWRLRNEWVLNQILTANCTNGTNGYFSQNGSQWHYSDEHEGINEDLPETFLNIIKNTSLSKTCCLNNPLNLKCLTWPGLASTQ